MPPHNMMVKEIVSAIIRGLFHQQAPAHIRIMNARRNSKGAIRAITHQNGTAEMALRYNCGGTAELKVGESIMNPQPHLSQHFKSDSCERVVLA
jgi:hypothetical protein